MVFHQDEVEVGDEVSVELMWIWDWEGGTSYVYPGSVFVYGYGVMLGSEGGSGEGSRVVG
jgi:hypothetical protein